MHPKINVLKSPKYQLLVSWLLLVLLAAVWGSSFILMKRALYSPEGESLLSPGQVAALRVSIASIVMLPFVLRNLVKNIRRFAIPLLLAGWLGNGLPAFFFAAAQTELDSGITGILNSLTPLFTLIVAFFIYGKRYVLFNYLGIFLALCGALLLILEHSHGLSGAPLWAYLLVILATVGYAFSVNILRNNLADLDAIRVTGLAMLGVSPFCIAWLAYDGFIGEVIHSAPMQEGLPYVFILAVVGTAAALVLFNHLIKISNALFASSVTYLIPVVAVLWGFADNETLTLTDLGLTAIIISGVYLVNLKKKQQNA